MTYLSNGTISGNPITGLIFRFSNGSKAMVPMLLNIPAEYTEPGQDDLSREALFPEQEIPLNAICSLPPKHIVVQSYSPPN
jgi:hypothetical protein